MIYIFYATLLGRVSHEIASQRIYLLSCVDEVFHDILDILECNMWPSYVIIESIQTTHNNFAVS